MATKYRRTPKQYDGTGLTSHRVADVLPTVLSQVYTSYREAPDHVIAAWKTIVGPTLAPMAQAISFKEGVVTVVVKNSTLYSLLSQHEGARLLQRLRQSCPSSTISYIAFRMG